MVFVYGTKGGAEETAEGRQPHRVRRKLSICPTLVGHGAELDEPEGPPVEPRPGLHEQDRRAQEDSDEEDNGEEERR